MQRALNASPVVAPEAAELVDHSLQIGPRNRVFAQGHHPGWIASLGHPAQIQHHLKQLVAGLGRGESLLNLGGQHLEQTIEVVGHPLGGHGLRD